MESQKKYPPVFSFEFFPPKTDDAVLKLREARDRLAEMKPRFFSVTFGAGGSTRERTYETVAEILRDTRIEAAPHLSCIASTRENISQVLSGYQELGIKKIVALRGDLPSGTLSAGEFRYANELVDFIRLETGDYFNIEVAAYPEVHPQADNAERDLTNFKRKVDAGANGAITQYFYNADAYYRFIDDCEKSSIDIPIVPGIMPVTNYSQLSRFSDACGAEIPRWMRKHLEKFGDDRKSIRAFGADVVTKLCQQLLENGAPGLHFYTMNQSKPTLTIWKNLDLDNYTPAT